MARSGAVLLLSRLMMGFFLGTVTTWYLLSPYLIQPAPSIIPDLLRGHSLANSEFREGKEVMVENWTKWRVFVNCSSEKTVTRVIEADTRSSLECASDAVLWLEWRSDYLIHVNRQSSMTSTYLELPSFDSHFGIYNHLSVESGDKSVRILPRFLFGIAPEVVHKLYGSDIAHFPLIGVFAENSRTDRYFIQGYMNMVILSVVLLMWANNPAEDILRRSD